MVSLRLVSFGLVWFGWVGLGLLGWVRLMRLFGRVWSVCLSGWVELSSCLFVEWSLIGVGFVGSAWFVRLCGLGWLVYLVGFMCLVGSVRLVYSVGRVWLVWLSCCFVDRQPTYGPEPKPSPELSIRGHTFQAAADATRNQHLPDILSSEDSNIKTCSGQC